MPCVDGRVPNAMDEMGSGNQQLDLPCIDPCAAIIPRYRCAVILVLYSEVDSRQMLDCDYNVPNLCEGREEAAVV
jgi:hypothetical protein